MSEILSSLDSTGREKKETDGDETGVVAQSNGGDKCRPLSHPDDERILTEILCLLRSQLEVFVLSPDDGDSRFRQMAGRVDVGRVGIRCIHCAGTKAVSGGGKSSSLPPVPVSRDGAVSYPKSIRLMYQSVRNWQRYHFMACKAMPRDVKERYYVLKSSGKQHKSSRASLRYWEESCRRMGMIDSDTGIKLQPGGFLSNSDEKDDVVDAAKHPEPKNAPTETVSVRYGVPTFNNMTETNSKSPSLGPQDLSLGGESDTVKPKVVPDAGTGGDGTSISERVQTVLSGETLPHPSITTERPALKIPAKKGGSSPGSGRREKEDAQLLEERQKHNASKETTSQSDLFHVDANPLLPVGPDQNGPSRSKQDNSGSGGPLQPQQRRPVRPLSNEALLQRVLLAVELVHAKTRTGALLEESVGGPTVMNQSQRIDLPNLGAELYTLFSGQAPSTPSNNDRDRTADNTREDGSHFQQERRKRERRRNDASHVPLHDLGFPAALSSLVTSLMDFSPFSAHNDYESIFEVEEDLRLMAAEPEKYFVRNVTCDLQLAQHSLHGRDEEISTLLKTFDQARSTNSTSNNLVLVSGYAGTGKSSLVQVANSSFTERGACFVSGKFDAMKQPQPLSAIASALDDYCDLLASKADRIDNIRDAVDAAIGTEGKVLASLIPNLRKISIVRDDSPVQITGRDAFQRICFMFRMLFWATCSRAHPVVLFLDDLQWADTMSLDLMQVLVTDLMIEGLLLIGSYRSNEVCADHPLMANLDGIRRSGNVTITPIHTTNLDSRSMNLLLSDVLHLTPRNTRYLSEVVTNKTGGNPLFAVQFLSSLHDEGQLYFSLQSRRWEWKIKEIREKDIADNVVELMVGKMLRLKPEVQEALSVAAGFGATCQESLLCIVDRSLDREISIVKALDVAVAEGLVVKSDATYRFSHDQIQAASYLLIPESERPSHHLRIGQSIMKFASAEETEKFLFVLVDQLHRGADLIRQRDEKVNLAQLCVFAAQKATGMSGFLAAASYLKVGIGLLVNEDWDQHRDLCFDLYNSCAETELTLGDFQGMTTRLEEVLKRAKTLQEKLKAYFILVRSAGAQGRDHDAINTTMIVLAQLGESFPAVVNEVTVKEEMIKTQKLLFMKKDGLNLLKPMDHSEKLVAMKFLRKLLMYSYTAKREYCTLVACRMVQLTLLHGVCVDSAFGFVLYGTVVCGQLRDVSKGYELCKWGLSIVEKFQSKVDLSKVQVLVHGTVFQWVQPSAASLPIFKESIDIGMTFGDADFIMLAMSLYANTAFFVGRPLETLHKEIQSHYKMAGFMQHSFGTQLKPLLQTILNLLGRSASPTKLVGEEMDESLLFSEEGIIAFRCNYHRLFLEYLFGEYELAWETARSNQENFAKYAAASFSQLCTHNFYWGLAALHLARKEVKNEYVEAIGVTMAQMEKLAASAPWNCQHRLELMKAEYAYLQGSIAEAVQAYDHAADTAAKHSFQHEQGVALERKAIFYLECGNNNAASEYFKRAHDCYTQWGAICKASQVSVLYL